MSLKKSEYSVLWRKEAARWSMYHIHWKNTVVVVVGAGLCIVSVRIRQQEDLCIISLEK